MTLREISPAPVFPEWQPASALQAIEAGEFCFLNVTHPASGYIPWSSQGFSRLWLYHLNYCDFLNVDLRGTQQHSHLRKALDLARDWCAQNTTGREVGWEPYPLSLRIVNWLKFLVRNAVRAEALGEGKTLHTLLASLRIQALSLETQLETDLLANHLLKNIKALIFAGTLLEAPEASRWLALGTRLLERELAEQVLPDGGHFERSAMYHAQVLEDLLDLETLASASGRPRAALSGAVARMARCLRRVLHPDGEIPLLNDSAFGIARPARELLTLAGDSAEVSSSGHPEVKVLAETGYAVIRDPNFDSCLIFDCGPLGPDYQPGHGHCDVLSYELSLHGQRVVTDTGVSTYERCAERGYERSTAAHNTLRIDGEEQAEIWASFRVGRRPRVGRIEAGETAGMSFVRGEHFGYQHRGVIHSRAIVHVPQDSWVIADTLRGAGQHRVESFIHFHPDVRVEPYANSHTFEQGTLQAKWLVHFAEHHYVLMVPETGRFSIAESWYAPEFGVRRPRRVLHGMWDGSLPVRLLYALAPLTSNPLIVRETSGEKGAEINGVLVPVEYNGTSSPC